ncbi:MAG: DUF1501 domain-containing protein, partial [Verrucomicrobiales bacterium]|nr:DUF1501 domain-containing protein [Verrucomicrobiales bacterium]
MLTRRDMLRRTAAGFGSLGLYGMLGAAQGQGAGPMLPAKAKRVIFLFMNGGPSHVDTFDPKPELVRRTGEKPSGSFFKKPNENAVLMGSPLEFKKYGESGVELSETMPELAGVIDECAVIRSMHTDIPNHEPALLKMHTGHTQPTRPSLGSWLMYGLGTENENLPGYVVLRPSNQIVVGPALWSSAFLPASNQATNVFTNDMAVDKLLANIKNGRLGAIEQRRQMDFVAALNRRHLEARGGRDGQLEGQIASMETAFRMQAEASDVFDISKEKAGMREMYGETPFGRSCLLARRLSESGVRAVTVYYTEGGTQPWDTHANHDKQHRKLCADGDRGAAALIRDLKARGLLDETLVIWGGEFGRTPYSQVQKKGAPGRDHHNTGFSMMLAGGGVKKGCVYGATDELGIHAVENRVHVHDL